MIDSGAALSVMGNHEFNALAYGTPDGEGGWLRPHTPKNVGQCASFLSEYEFGSAEHTELLRWFAELPLWLDLGDLRIVHACWDQMAMALLEREHSGARLTDTLLRAASDKQCAEFGAVETLLKGKEIPLPDGASFQDKDENLRHHIRIRWWDTEQPTYRGLFLGPESVVSHIPDDPIDGDHAIEYGHAEPPVFLGHYWMSGEPAPLAPNVACVDYSVAKPGGHLVAYRWDGEQTLDQHKFVAVQRIAE